QFRALGIETAAMLDSLDNTVLEQMQQGRWLQFAFFIKNQQITYPVSLDGFAQTYKILASNHTG
ncbi:MAG: hypothetical protein ABF267_06830, partial [Glaciecola sp.]